MYIKHSCHFKLALLGFNIEEFDPTTLLLLSLLFFGPYHHLVLPLSKEDDLMYLTCDPTQYVPHLKIPIRKLDAEKLPEGKEFFGVFNEMVQLLNMIPSTRPAYTLYFIHYYMEFCLVKYPTWVTLNI